MTFDELRIKLGALRAIPTQPMRGASLAYEVPALPVDQLSSMPGLTMGESGFPECFEFFVPVAEGRARFVGLARKGLGSTPHIKGTLELQHIVEFCMRG